MWRYISLAVVSVAIVVFGFSLVDVGGGTDIGGSAVLVNPDVDLDAYERATDTDYDWQFPEDHGPHPDFLTEWWYYTGNVATPDGRRFGYQFTIFRRALLPPDGESDATEADSEWRTRQVYLAHFTVSDIANEAFYHDEIFSRGAAGLAGATTDPVYRVWMEDWEVRALNDDATELQLTADMGDAALDLTLEQLKPPVLQGTNGLSPKSDDPGNASYYYSMPRLGTQGTLTVDGETFNVDGETWMDHEFSTSALGTNAQGWDWFGLIFEDGRELMIGQIRLQDGGKELAFGGMLVNKDGSGTYLPAESFTIEVTDTWDSPHTGATYPAGWDIRIDADTIGASEPLTFQVDPLMADQELYDTDPSYWEGAVRVTGDVTGYGYAELTGYVQTMANRF